PPASRLGGGRGGLRRAKAAVARHRRTPRIRISAGRALPRAHRAFQAPEDLRVHGRAAEEQHGQGTQDNATCANCGRDRFAVSCAICARLKSARKASGGQTSCPNLLKKSHRRFGPGEVSTKSFGRPRAFRVVTATKRADHKPLRGRSVTRKRADSLRWTHALIVAFNPHTRATEHRRRRPR